MRIVEKKKEYLKAIISYIICENPAICEIVKDATSRRQQKFTVQIKKDCNSWGSKDNGHIILGIGNLKRLIEICNDFNSTYNLEYNTENSIFNYSTDDDLNVEIYDVEEDFLNNIEFLNGTSVETVGTLAINALAFTLYHEFGHVKYDDYCKLSIENERRADLFAFEVVKDRCSEKDICFSPFFIGALLESVLILKVCDPSLSEVDTSHPHPIERLYCLLEYFHIQKDSFLWEYVYSEVVCWLNDNNIDMAFVKNFPISAKDKFLNVYLRFKK